MKNKILNICIGLILILGLTGCKNEEKEIVLEENRYLSETTLDDGRIIRFELDVPYKDSDLGYSLLINDLTIDKFIDKLEYVDALNDGGSKVYFYDGKSKEFGKKEFYTIVCNSLDGIKDIYISQNKENLNNKCSIKFDDLEGVSMTVKKDTLTSRWITIIITDTSGRENIYGEGYRIDKKEDGKWIELEPKKDNIKWNNKGYTVGKDNTLEFTMDWKKHYGKLKKGTYRIVKNTSEAKEFPLHYITAEFNID